MVTRRAEFAHDVLGPVFLKYLFTLDTYAGYAPVPTAPLYVARAGVRIKELHDLYLESAGRQSAKGEVFWTSRMLAAKGSFTRSPDLVAKLMAREFPNGRLREVTAGLFRHEPEWLDRLPEDHPQLNAGVGSLAEIVADRSGPVGALLGEYFELYAELFERYLSGLIQGTERIVLIDSGWAGTIARLLHSIQAAPEVIGLFFGRVTRPGEEWLAAPDAVGLVLDSPGYNPADPATALTFHRHIIEAALETAGPSIETLADAADGGVTVPLAGHPGHQRPVPEAEDMVAAIRSYIADHAQDGPSAIFAEGALALDRLASAVLYPERADVELLTVGSRSADFGRSHTVPVLVEDPSGDDGPDARIARALWPQGQIALEYEGVDARRRQELVAGAATAAGYFSDFADSSGSPAQADSSRPAVAIITRTKDRAVLLRRAADSVSRQTLRDYCWVVVNDGGDEAAARAVVESAAVPKDTITFVSNRASVGMEAASNLGVRNSDSEFVVIHDDDDSWDPAFLQTTVDFLRSERGAKYGGVITHSTYVSEEIRGDDVVVHETRPYNDWVRSVGMAEIASNNLFPPIAFVFRRETYEALDGFDESLPVLGDWDFNLRFLDQTDIAVIPTPLAFYHHRDVVPSGLYSNSVIGGQDLHAEYDAIVRNRMARRMHDQDPLAPLSMVGYTLQVLRHELRSRFDRLEAAPAVGAGGAGSSIADDWWVALNALARDGVEPEPVAERTWWQRLRSSGPEIAPERTATDVHSLIQDLRKKIKVAEVPTPRDFDEASYLGMYPDVAEAVQRGDFKSGYHHFLVFGRSEGRARPTR